MTEKGHKHYRSEEWVDFVNENLSAEQTRAMQQHLDANCRPCSRMARTWTRVRDAAKRESRYQAPDSAVRHVRGSFSLLARPAEQNRLVEIPRLVFDSLWQPAVAGLRAASVAPRQVLYKAGDLAIEMRMEPEPLSERISIAGQIYNTAQQGEGLADVLVVVRSNTSIVAEARTNRFGEFQLSFVPDEGLRIAFVVVKNRDLSIPLDGKGAGIFFRN